MALTDNPRSKNAVFNVIVLLVAAFIAWSFIYKKQEKERQDLIAKQELETKKNAVLTNIGELEKKLESYKTLLPARDQSAVMNTIGDMVKGTDAKIVSLKPSAQEAKTADYKKSMFDMVVSAPSYHALGKFISKLENYQDVFIVDSVQIASQGEKKELNAIVKVSTITFAEK